MTSIKKKFASSKGNVVWHRSAEEATRDQMPRYNAHICKTGAHGDLKYNRAKQKREFEQRIKREGTRFGGPLPFAPPREGQITENTSTSFQAHFYASTGRADRLNFINLAARAAGV